MRTRIPKTTSAGTTEGVLSQLLKAKGTSYANASTAAGSPPSISDLKEMFQSLPVIGSGPEVFVVMRDEWEEVKRVTERRPGELDGDAGELPMLLGVRVHVAATRAELWSIVAEIHREHPTWKIGLLSK